MQIIVIGHSAHDSMEWNIAQALQQMGHKVSVFPIFSKAFFSDQWMDKAAHLKNIIPNLEEFLYRDFLHKSIELKPDLIINTKSELPPRVVTLIKRGCAAKIAVWYPDHFVSFGRQYVIGADYDALFFKDEYIVKFFREKLGRKNVFFLPEACNPDIHKPVSLSSEDRNRYGCDLTVASNMYYYRARMLEQFMNYDLKIWGVSYPRWLDSPIRRCYQFYYVTGEEKAKAFNAAKIVLNTMHYGEILGVNARTFEAAGCGGFQIADWKPNMALFFEPGKEIVTFQSLEELKEKVTYYLAHDSERAEIARNASKRAHKEHTYKARLTSLLSAVFEDGQGYPMSDHVF